MNYKVIVHHMILIRLFFLFTFSLLMSGCAHLHSQRAPVKHGYLEYYRLGHGSPVVLIPGYITDVSSWDRRFVEALAQQHDVIVLNNRNVGRSSIRSYRYESSDLAEDTYQLIRTLKLHKPAVVGISMGGMIAQHLAVLHSDQLGQLILINTAIAGRQSIKPCLIVREKLWEMPKKTKLQRYLLALELFFPHSWRLPMAYSLAFNRFQPIGYKELNPLTVMKPQQHLLSQWAQDDVTASRLKKVNIPVLILNGQADMVIPPINSIILYRNFTQAQLLRWPEGGHAMIYQYPQPMANAINCFIRKTI
jgi:pimeloyl-ACP methyl ester carboxylesterase